MTPLAGLDLPRAAPGDAEDLRDGEQSLRLAIAATGIGIWDVDTTTGRRRWSPEFLSILGLPPDTEPDMALFASLIHPDDRDHVNELYRSAYASPGAPTYKAEFRIIRANDGVERWVVTTGRVYFDAAGRSQRGVGTLRDIDERRRMEEALRVSEERYRALVQASAAIEWRSAADGALYDAPLWERFTGQPAERHRGSGWREMVHPDDLAAVIAVWDEGHATGNVVEIDYRVFHAASGRHRWVRESGVPLKDADGRIREWVGTVTDIDERRQALEELRISEERHRLAIAANKLGTWDIDLVKDEHRWSAEYRALWGLAPDDPADPKLLQPLVAQQDWQRFQLAMAEAREGDGHIEVELPFTRASDGVARWALLQGQIFFDAARRPVRALGIMMDTTDRKQAEERQRMLLNELNHRVKNTLATVQAIVSQTLRSTPEPEAAFQRVQARLLALSNTHNLLNATSWAGANLADVLSAELRPYLGYGDRVALHGDSVALDAKTALAFGLIVHELATNAAKYGSLSMPAGRVDVTWRLFSENGEPSVELVWREVGGPPVAPPARRGFGSRLIERSARDLRGRVDVDYAAAGLLCRLVFCLHAWAPEKPGDEAAAEPADLLDLGSADGQ